jgi:hypothetical protein
VGVIIVNIRNDPANSPSTKGWLIWVIFCHSEGRLTYRSDYLGLLAILILVSRCNPRPTRIERGAPNSSKHVTRSHNQGSDDGDNSPCPFVLQDRRNETNGDDK